MMNNFFSTPEFPEFPIEELEAELEQEHAEFKSAIQELSQKLLAQLKERNPGLMGAKIIEQNDIQCSITLARRQRDGISLEYSRQVQDIVRRNIYSQIEKEIGRPITPAELISGPSFTSISEIKRLDQVEEDYEFTVGKGMLNHYLTYINKIIPEDQTTRPNIRIFVYAPSWRGAQMFTYVESNGIVLIDDIFKPPTVTLDTNVVREWWDNRSKIEYVEKLLELGKKFEIDLAVTRRIRDDVPNQPLAAKINDLPNLLIHEIGAVMRLNNWEAGIDTIGITEFVSFIELIENSDEFNHMNKDKRPDWRDWDHIHTHYRYSRNYFLTWDGRVLHFKKAFEDFGIKVMKPEEYLSQHQSPDLERWVQETISNFLQN